MHKTLFKQKLQRAINRWRLGLRFSLAQQIKQIISADSAILQTHQAQHFETLLDVYKRQGNELLAFLMM